MFDRKLFAVRSLLLLAGVFLAACGGGDRPERPPIPDVLSEVERIEARMYHAAATTKMWEFLGGRAKEVTEFACEDIKDAFYRKNIVTRPVSTYPWYAQAR